MARLDSACSATSHYNWGSCGAWGRRSRLVESDTLRVVDRRRSANCPDFAPYGREFRANRFQRCGCSSVDRVLASEAKGRGFDPRQPHQSPLPGKSMRVRGSITVPFRHAYASFSGRHAYASIRFLAKSRLSVGRSAPFRHGFASRWHKPGKKSGTVTWASFGWNYGYEILLNGASSQPSDAASIFVITDCYFLQEASMDGVPPSFRPDSMRRQACSMDT